MADRKPFISLYGKPNQIHVSKSVVKLLGNPSHITIYKNDSMSSVAFGVCEAKNVMSFRVPPEVPRRNFIISSKQFLYDLMRLNKLDFEKTYRIEGRFLEDKNMVAFDICDAVDITRNAD